MKQKRRVICTTRHERNGVYFSVRYFGMPDHWSVYVPFGHNRANRLGGRAFIDAALEQARQAESARTLVGKG